jgi:hypothetical protein
LPYKADECPGCGHVVNRTGKAAAQADTDELRCAWVSGSVRCHYAGTISESTVGAGPWYCAGHADALTAEFPMDVGEKVTRQSVEDYPSPSFRFEARRLAALRAMAARGEAVDAAKAASQ